MPFSIDRIVPWGRSLDEYRAMFGLDGADMRRRILGCGDGPASFNAEMSRNGHAVVSVDPLYGESAAAIKTRIDETFDEVMAQMRDHFQDFVWTQVRSVEEVGRSRMDAMHKFLADFPRGKLEGRYVQASLPDLPFGDTEFDLALSSHFLFLYSQELDLQFHVEALAEMLRVAAEVRVFPLLQNGGVPSPHVPGVIETFVSRGVEASVEPVAYEFQRGGNQLLRLRRTPPESARGPGRP